MRTNIDIDDELLAQAMRNSGAKTKKDAVEAGLRLLLKIEAQGAILALRGKVKWEGDLDISRLNRTFNHPVEDRDRRIQEKEG